MPNGGEWIKSRIADARKLHASVPDAVSVRVSQLLTAALTERQLPSTELAKIASALIADMLSAEPTPEGKQ